MRPTLPGDLPLVCPRCRTRDEAGRHGLETRTLRLPGLELDVDEPADLSGLVLVAFVAPSFLAGRTPDIAGIVFARHTASAPGR